MRRRARRLVDYLADHVYALRQGLKNALGINHMIEECLTVALTPVVGDAAPGAFSALASPVAVAAQAPATSSEREETEITEPTQVGNAQRPSVPASAARPSEAGVWGCVSSCAPLRELASVRGRERPDSGATSPIAAT